MQREHGEPSVPDTQKVEKIGCMIVECNERGGKNSHENQARYCSEERWQVGDVIALEVAGNSVTYMDERQRD